MAQLFSQKYIPMHCPYPSCTVVDIQFYIYTTYVLSLLFRVVDVQLNEVNTLLDTQDATKLLAALQSPAIGLKDVQSENAEYYLTTLIQAREVKKEVSC